MEKGVHERSEGISQAIGLQNCASQEGQLVLLPEQHVERGQWKEAVVDDVIYRKDGEPRGAVVHKSSGKRAISIFLFLYYCLYMEAPQAKGLIYRGPC